MNEEKLDTKKFDLKSELPFIITILSAISVASTGFFYWYDKIYLSFYGISSSNVEIDLVARLSEIVLLSLCSFSIVIDDYSTFTNPYKRKKLSIKLIMSIIIALVAVAMFSQKSSSILVWPAATFVYMILNNVDDLVLSNAKLIKVKKLWIISTTIFFIFIIIISLMNKIIINDIENKEFFTTIQQEQLAIVYETKEKYFCINIIEEVDDTITLDKSTYIVKEKVDFVVKPMKYETVIYID